MSLGKATAGPYTVNWANVPAGTYTLTAVATDNDGGTTTSAPVTVTVAGGLRSTPISCGQGFTGSLSAQDGTSPTLGAGHSAHLYTFAGSPNAVVTLSLNSTAFAGYPGPAGPLRRDPSPERRGHAGPDGPDRLHHASRGQRHVHSRSDLVGP